MDHITKMGIANAFESYQDQIYIMPLKHEVWVYLLMST